MSRFLLDTHVWLWLQTTPERLGERTHALLVNRAHDLLLSAASGWEIAVKHGLGRLPLPAPPAIYVPDRMRRSGTTPLPVEHAHVLRVADLPDHHRDPFDRLLVAQSQLLGVPLVTADHQLAAYEIETIPV